MAWSIVNDRSHDMAVHAVLVPGGNRGRILYFGGYRVYDTHLFDPETETVSSDISTANSPEGKTLDPFGYNIFCAGHAFLADGRILIAGGQLQVNTKTGLPGDPPADLVHVTPNHPGKGHGLGWGGERQAATFHPLTATWFPADSMHLAPSTQDDSGGRWYPTLTTLGNGEVLAVGGHPNLNEVYPPSGAARHSNSSPERYNPTHDSWTLLTGDPPADNQITAPNGAENNVWDYQRNHLLPKGVVFFTTPIRWSSDGGNPGFNRFYDPFTGSFTGPDVTLPSDSAYHYISAEYTSVMLPLLRGDQYRPRVLLFGGQKSYRIDLGAQNPAWEEAAGRVVSGTPIRRWVCPVLMPDGNVFFSGGTSGDNDDSVLIPEIYDPAIDWANSQYHAGTGGWSAAEAATVKRHYHSTALLMPNGAVWTAGSNGPTDDPLLDTNANPGERELRIEIYKPWYFAQQNNRPIIDDPIPTNVSYSFPFEIKTSAANQIARVAFLRAGSVTHGFNPDQRYIEAHFEKVNNSTLRVWAPPNGNIAPPGRYLLWILDGQNRPCTWAPFIRISDQKCYVTEDVSTYSIHEVKALGTPGAVFKNACYIVFDTFLPDEVETPSVVIETKNGGNVSGMVASVGAVSYEGNPLLKDVTQRIVYPVDITFNSEAPFDLVQDGEDFGDVKLVVTMRLAYCEASLTLSLNPNPRMSDGSPHWLSIDLRAFKVKLGELKPYAPGVEHTGDVYGYIQSLLTKFNTWTEDNPGEAHPFDAIPAGLEGNELAWWSEEDNDNEDKVPVYNYAVARVRFRAPEDITAENVRVFFRLWTTGWTALSYGNPHADTGSYRRYGDGPTAPPLLGIRGGEINNFPCFAEPREADMTKQKDLTNLLPQLKGAGAQEVHAYFGCWLDNNQETKLFPLEPVGNGPFGSDALSIQELMRGPHQCLVAELYYVEDTTPSGSTPSSSDNLAQRNILFDKTENPGGFASHLAHHTFEIKPSPNDFPHEALSIQAAGTAGAHRLHADELCIDWGNLPRDSHVTLFLPQIDIGKVMRYAGQRNGVANLSRVGDHALRIKVTDVGFVPIPGPFSKNIAALMSIQLPPNVTKGQRFHVVLRQVDGRRTKVFGTTQFDILVKTATEVRPELERTLSVMKHVALSIPESNRWFPIFERYLGELSDRVRAAGGDPDAIEPTPTGSGKRKPRPERPDKQPWKTSGKVMTLIYDCFGDFEGFTLADCDKETRFESREKRIEDVVRRACAQRIPVTVYSDKGSPRPRQIVLYCDSC